MKTADKNGHRSMETKIARTIGELLEEQVLQAHEKRVPPVVFRPKEDDAAADASDPA